MTSTFRSTVRFSVLLFSVATFVVIYGCGSEVELGEVHGTISLDGKPLPEATVRFVPEKSGRSALGRTDENGHYEMLYSANADGALVGPMRVEVTTAEEVEGEYGRSHMTPEKIPPRYNTQSELKVDVESGDNTFDFDLKSK